MKPILLAALAALGTSSFAALINPSFEAPTYNTGFYGSNGMPGWSSASSYGAWNIPTSGFFTTEAPDGTQIGYSNHSSMAQLSSDALSTNTVTLSVQAGRRTDDYASSFFLQLWVGTGVLDGNFLNGTKLAEIKFDVLSIAKTSFTKVELSYTADAGNSNIGKLLGVRFERTGVTGSQMDMDDVRLLSVPEPSTALFLVAAPLLMLAKRRR